MTSKLVHQNNVMLWEIGGMKTVASEWIIMLVIWNYDADENMRNEHFRFLYS